MPRVDLLTNHTVIVASGRVARPHTVAPTRSGATTPPDDCPFCRGHEGETPPEIARRGEGAPDTPGWRVRIVPNKYPILGGDGEPGAHEVVVLSPDHCASFGNLDEDAAVEVFDVLRDRAHHHVSSGRAFALALINHQREAGASIAHPHAQVLALDFVPRPVADATERLDADALDADRRAGAPVVEGDGASAWCPFASESPYLVRVAASDGGPHFDEAEGDVVAAVARTSRAILRGVERSLGDVAYNLVVHSAPPGGVAPPWYVEIRPRVAVVAGFELGTGVFVNTVEPADAAALLGGPG